MARTSRIYYNTPFYRPAQAGADTMRTSTYCSMTCLALALSGGLACTLRGEDTSGETGVRKPIIVMETSRVKGKILYLADNEHDEAPGAGILVGFYSEGHKKLVREARTDKNGIFRTSPLPAGRYELVVGRLALLLEVLAAKGTADPDPAAIAGEPKIILIVLPRYMGETDGASGAKASSASSE